jgi:hypothetical protein
MKTLSPLVLAMLAALAICDSASSADKGPTARAAWRNGPSKAAIAKVKRDLPSLFGPSAEWVHESSTYEWGFRTTTLPKSTGIAGLCFRDELMVDYAVVAPNDKVGPQPAQPIGLTARRTYHVIDGPVADYDKGSAKDRRSWMAECKKLQSDDLADWFPQGRAIEAAKAANLVRVAVTELQAGRLQPKDCTVAPDASACKGLILEDAKGLKIAGVHRNCGSGTAQECYAVDLDGDRGLVRVTMVASFDENTLVPKQITYISADNTGFELGAWDGISVDPEPRR